jgi:hypothetical protein
MWKVHYSALRDIMCCHWARRIALVTSFGALLARDCRPYPLAIGAGMLPFASTTQTSDVLRVMLRSAKGFLLPGPPEPVSFMTQLQ